MKKRKNKIKKISLETKLFLISHLITKKYNFTPREYNLNIINDIIFNINSRIVSHFKDFLLLYDPNDFLRRYYFKKESFQYLNYYISFYEENNKIFPNYYCLPESKYIYWNIRQKQNILNNIENINIKLKKRRKSYSTIFSSSIKRSIYNESEYPSNSIVSNGDEQIKKLINVINENYSNENSFNKFKIKKEFKFDLQKFTQNNNLSTNNKISLFPKPNEIDGKNKIKYENICLSDRIKNLNNISNKNIKHIRFMTNYNKELINICGNDKENKKSVKKEEKKVKKEKIKKLLKAIKLIYIKNNNNKILNHTIDIDNINHNHHNKIANTSRNIKSNNTIIKSFLNSINASKKNNSRNSNNKKENLKKNYPQKIKTIQEYNPSKLSSSKLNYKRIDNKKNKKILNHIKTNSILNSNTLIDTINKMNIYQPFLTNNNSISFNSPFLRKKFENKLSSTDSFPKIKILTQKRRNTKKLLIKKSLMNKRKALSGLYNIKENQNKNKIKNEKEDKISKEVKNDIIDFSTQINFRNHQIIKNNKDITPKTEEKIKNNIKKSKISLLTKNYNKKNSNANKNNNDFKNKKLELKSRNNTIMNSININLSSVKNLKISNNLFTTINIYGNSKKKIKSKIGLKTERTNYKFKNNTSYLENKKLKKKTFELNDYKYLNKNNQTINNNSNNVIKNYHNKTNSSINNNIDFLFSINKTTSNFNHLINKNAIYRNAYNFVKNQKLKIKKIKPSLIKKIDKDYMHPQSSERFMTCYKNDSIKIKTEEFRNTFSNRTIKLNNTNNEIRNKNIIRKISYEDKRVNAVSSTTSEKNNKKNKKKIKLKNFKQLIGNLNSEKKEIDPNKVDTILKKNILK